MERYEYLNGPPAPRMVAELAMRHDALVKQLADAQATIAALQARVQELRKVIERVAHHGPIMGSRGEYRQGQIDVLESVRRIAQEELYGSHQIAG